MTAERSRQHELVFRSLPFYANGTLNPQETGQLEAHLAGCLSCQAELVRWRWHDARVEAASLPFRSRIPVGWPSEALK